MPGLERAEEAARLACERADAGLHAALAEHDVRFVTVEPSGSDRVVALLDHGAHRITVEFVLGADADHDASALLDVLRRPPDTWDARWRGTTDDTRDVRPGIAGPRWRMEQR